MSLFCLSRVRLLLPYIGSLLGKFMVVDPNTLNIGDIRVRVIVDIDQPILKKLFFLLDTGVEALLKFEFENLVGWCM